MQFLKDDPHGTVKAYFLSSAIWFVIATVEGFIDATHLAAPELMGNIPYIFFGRIRPMHTNTIMIGFAGTMLLGAAQYLVYTLLRTELYSERLGKLGLWIWNLSIAGGTIGLAFGLTQGREYAEWIWPFDIGILASFAIVFYNCFMTALRRKENVFYVSVWYVFASLIFTWFIYFSGNAVWNPSTGSSTGIMDAMLHWFYGHGIIGLFLTPLSVAIAYYVVPIVTRSPLYSHTLSLVGFWTILMIYTHIGSHHLLQTPVPTWHKVLATAGSIAMIIPVMTVLINLWLTMRGRLGYIHADIGGKWIMAGLVWYILTCTQGPLQALPMVQRITHLNNWVIAHSHMGVGGFAGMIGIGGIYFILPRITGRPIYNPRLADVQYWMFLIGMAGFFGVLTAAGLVQGNSWLNGEVVYRTVPMLNPYYVVRAAIGLLFVASSSIGLYNIYRTIYGVQPEVKPVLEVKHSLEGRAAL